MKISANVLYVTGFKSNLKQHSYDLYILCKQTAKNHDVISNIIWYKMLFLHKLSTKFKFLVEYNTFLSFLYFGAKPHRFTDQGLRIC